MFNKRNLIKDILEKFDLKSRCEYLVYGRLLTKRQSVNYIFLDVSDYSGRMQVVLDRMVKNINVDFIKLNPGDFYKIKGTLFVTKSGEKSIMASNLEKISFASMSLPKKIEDPELIINKRFLDLATDSNLLITLKLRSNLMFQMRNYLFNNGFIEADTPILQEKAVVGTATPFVTYCKCLGRDLYLRGSCEIKLKQLIVGGYEKVFEIGPVFRNESESLVEFPLLEVEMAYCTYEDMATMIESMLKKVFVLLQVTFIKKDDGVIDLIKKPWRRISVVEAIKIYYKNDLDIFDCIVVDRELELIKCDVKVKDKDFRRAQLINTIVKKFISSKLLEPTFLMNFPKLLSPLAIVDKNNSYFAERGYLYINGQRLCEVVSEENNPEKQKESFTIQNYIYGIDNHIHNDLIDALSYGCPPTGGIGLNINRLVVLLTGYDKLDSVTFFPLSTSSVNK